MTGRNASRTASLARAGFSEPDLASPYLDQASVRRLGDVEELVVALGRTADPDLALSALAGLSARVSDPDALARTFTADPGTRDRLLAVLGASPALAEHLLRHPDQWRALESEEQLTPTALRRRLLTAVGADAAASVPQAVQGGPGPVDALRVAYRAALLDIAGRDLTGVVRVDDVAAELADLAGATLEAALAVARADLGDEALSCRLAIIAMGKTGGRELNYVSDVDVIFVGESVDATQEGGALRAANLLAAATIRVCSVSTGEGTIWPVDAALRPEGKAGPLVRTLASHVTYYERWAKTWEFQALLKARPVAGDVELGQGYVEAIGPLVWAAAGRPGFVVDVQEMRRRVESTLPANNRTRQLKLGPGGLRDVEFAVQLLQLVHGRNDERLRSPNTLEALEALSTHGYVGRDDAAELDRAYRFLRTVEHRLQLHRLRRTHVMPDDPGELRRLGRSVGFRTAPLTELDEQWRLHAREVRRLHEKLFYRPLLASVARLGPSDARLTPAAAQARLEALGYVDPVGALHHLEALTTGVSRRAAIQRTLLPVMLAWFADAPDPDGGLLAFRQVSEALGSTPWYLRLLRDEGAVAERLAHLLASSRYLVDLLLRAPESVALLADDAELQPRSRAALAAELAAAVGRQENPEAAVAAARAIRRRELFRVAVADLLGVLDVAAVGSALTDITAATIQATLEVATRVVQGERAAMPTTVAVIAMGRFGGGELGYSSDADVLFVHDPVAGADEREATDAAHAVANEVRRLLGVPAPDPPLLVDADLRPEGRQGPLVRTLASYAAYYARWSAVWESQALLRAHPTAGDGELGRRFLELIDPLRYPSEGLDDPSVREIRRIKARIDSERLPRGTDPARHTKLGPGGLADVEWTVQLLQLRHGAVVAGLRTPATLNALRAAEAAGLLEETEADTLAFAWTLVSRVRNAMMLVSGRRGDSLPVDMRELSGVARVLGYAPGAAGTMVEEYRRATRRARTVVDGVFYR